MKLCSQCEFIYEDDQERCDMDGAELVYEPTLDRVLPNNVVQVGIANRGRGVVDGYFLHGFLRHAAAISNKIRREEHR